MEVNRQMLARVSIRGAGMGQWWERSPPTNVSRVIIIMVIVIIISILILTELVVLHHYSG